MADTDQTSEASALTVQILSACLADHTVPTKTLADLIRTTKAALMQETSSAAEAVVAEVFTPAVTPRKSLASPEHIISMIDGKPYKTLKRVFASRGSTPEQYRNRYNLPASYPMVAPAYAEQRREVAHRLGLGRKGPALESAEEQADFTTVDEPKKQTFVEVAPDRIGVPTTCKGKQTSFEKVPAVRRAQPRKKATDLTPLDSAAGAHGNVPESKPAKLRGKIGLFKNATDESAPTASDAGQPAADLAVKGGNTALGGAAPAGSKAKTRAFKRMARAPKD